MHFKLFALPWRTKNEISNNKGKKYFRNKILMVYLVDIDQDTHSKKSQRFF